MFQPTSLLKFLQRTSLIILLTLSIIMLFHIFIITLGTSLMIWHTDSTPFDMALLTFLYYVIPLIALLSFYLLISQLVKLDEAVLNAKSKKKHATGKAYSKQPLTQTHSNTNKNQSNTHKHRSSTYSKSTSTHRPNLKPSTKTAKLSSYYTPYNPLYRKKT